MPSFVDTNVLVYAEDADAGPKREAARRLVIDLWRSREGVVSVQVLQELYITLTRKLKHPVPQNRARGIVREYLSWTVVENTGALLMSALDLHRSAKLGFWDAMIVQAAVEGGCGRLYSEDLNAGQRFGPVEVVNPFG